MARVEVYTTASCPYCVRAKRLLEERRIPYDEFDVARDPERPAAGGAPSGGRRTVPQIFIDGRAIGGFEELAALDAAGGLADLRVDAAF